LPGDELCRTRRVRIRPRPPRERKDAFEFQGRAKHRAQYGLEWSRIPQRMRDLIDVQVAVGGGELPIFLCENPLRDTPAIGESKVSDRSCTRTHCFAAP
jgi:hypothetical protein